MLQTKRAFCSVAHATHRHSANHIECWQQTRLATDATAAPPDRQLAMCLPGCLSILEALFITGLAGRAVLPRLREKSRHMFQTQLLPDTLSDRRIEPSHVQEP
ncbi:hypothetical protein G6O67_004571 [Ophiocordyceps sinensis]|uniref:Uncharacterized protein n=1 Tax=Ophiocordyceps sinensis TaxID=72228 RepID=A0A8H4PPP2_9HYPO|nr:hypothetical protein G6O67_004571 [Ophiocordyceps sinensis]